MSTYYNIRTEVKINGMWHCVEPLILHLNNEGGAGEYQLALTYWSGSRSYFGAAADKLIEMSVSCKYDDYSPEIRAVLIPGSLILRTKNPTCLGTRTLFR